MLTALLATRNGERRLGRTLDALCRLESPPSAWRLVVVDNGSTDGTPALLGRYRQRLPMTVLHEPRPGKSVALNRALADVGDGLVVFLDDDIVPDPGWLRQYDTLAAAERDFSIFAGTIRPRWEAEPPSWIRAWVDLSVCFGIHVDRPEGECPDYVVYGGNMAVRAGLVRAGHRFANIFGPDDRPTYAMGGETHFVRGLIAAGHRAWYSRSAVVRHVIPADHMTRAWLLNRAVNYGRGEYLVGGATMNPLRGKSGARMTAYFARGIAANRWRARLARFAGSGQGEFRALWRMNQLAGMALEHRNAMSGGADDALSSPQALAGAERGAR